eukprot:CAMPEP_0204536062 /NCGR_PEP_ID=MMETSP0661-20131031/14180_1 /ASSEMBLY_ACC=CAM_ASM_000606 /TAXON_ID=109239 /ORGANISM="Alexandrium margalefi, Strain AMGDE01CS-322" /LENGTH=84 /DNA_ID=CAMNT_0051542577 /DNA_START=38 /DNA_END=292 /DNA_ORIENTATION=+
MAEEAKRRRATEPPTRKHRTKGAQQGKQANRQAREQVPLLQRGPALQTNSIHPAAGTAGDAEHPPAEDGKLARSATEPSRAEDG